jgi:hypothetical protein
MWSLQNLITESLFRSTTFAFADSSSSHAVNTQFRPSRLPFVYRNHCNTDALPPYKGAWAGRYGYGLIRFPYKTATTGDPIWPNYTLLVLCDYVGSPIKLALFVNDPFILVANTFLWRRERLLSSLFTINWRPKSQRKTIYGLVIPRFRRVSRIRTIRSKSFANMNKRTPFFVCSPNPDAVPSIHGV